MSIREIANIGTSDLFGMVKIGLYIVFVAVILATPFIIAKRFDVDLITAIKKLMGKNRDKREENDAYNQGYRKGLFRIVGNLIPEGIFECENGMCTRKVEVGKHGAFIRSADSGRRKIVCSECAEAFIKTGWIPVMTWGDSFKSSSAALMLVGGSLRSIPLFLGEAPTLLRTGWNPGIFLVRLMLYGLAGIIIHWVIWGEHEE